METTAAELGHFATDLVRIYREHGHDSAALLISELPADQTDRLLTLLIGHHANA